MFYTNIRYSKNGNRTKTDWRVVPLGELGDFCRRVVLRRFGSSRQFVFTELVTDDCAAHLIAASVQTEQGGP